MTHCKQEGGDVMKRLTRHWLRWLRARRRRRGARARRRLRRRGRRYYRGRRRRLRAETSQPADTGAARTASGGRRQRTRQRVRRRLGRRRDAQALVAGRPRGAGDRGVDGRRWSQQFQTEYPNVTVETTLYETETGSRRRQTACQSGSGPDLWYNWSGTWSLEPAWKGCTVPNETVLSAGRHRGEPARRGDALGGQDLGLPALQVRLPDRLQQRPVRAGGARPERSARDMGRVDGRAGADQGGRNHADRARTQGRLRRRDRSRRASSRSSGSTCRTTSSSS